VSSSYCYDRLMCGRYNQRTPLTVLAQQLQFELDSEFAWRPRYNIAPTQQIPVVRLVDGQVQLAMLKWGLVSSWSKDPKLAPINARADSVATKPMFRSAYKCRRCLVLADGYYEWQRDGKTKLPYLYEVDGGPFAIAGLWEGETCTLLTTDANELAARSTTGCRSFSTPTITTPGLLVSKSRSSRSRPNG